MRPVPDCGICVSGEKIVARFLIDVKQGWHSSRVVMGYSANGAARWGMENNIAGRYRNVCVFIDRQSEFYWELGEAYKAFGFNQGCTRGNRCARVKFTRRRFGG